MSVSGLSARKVTEVQLESLPAAVRDSARRQSSPAGSTRSYFLLEDGNRVEYEMKVLLPSGKQQEIVFRRDGTVVEFEEEIELSAVPKAAKEKIEAAARSLKLVKVDLIRRDGKLLYEGEFLERGSKVKLIFDEAGVKVND